MRPLTRSLLFSKIRHRLFTITLLACLATSIAAQTRVDLSTQSKGIDFQAQPYTKPLKSGPSLPAICTQAELFFLSSAPPGGNIYACTATNSWTLQTVGGGGTVTNITTSGPLLGGTITTTGALSCPTCTTNSAAAAVNAIMLGGGAQTISPLGSLGSTTMVLHGNASGAPAFGALNLATDVTGNLGVGNLNSGTAASGSTFWRGDGTWATPAGAGTVTHTGALTLNSPLLGNGGADITAGTTQGNTTKFISYAGSAPAFNDCAKFDINGNLTTNGAACGTGGGGGSGTVTSIATSGPLSGGPITATGTLSCPTCTTNAASATIDAIMLGGGSQVISALGSLGTSTTVLHGNAAGPPAFSAISLATDVTGSLGVGHLNSGASASAATFWRGDGTWATPAGGGTVTHTAGALTANQLMLGNGAADAKVGDLTGDVTTSGSTLTTLATVNGGPGVCGDASHVCVVTTTGKGLVTAQTATLISGGGGGSGTVTHTAGALTLNAPVIGNGAGDVTVGTTAGNTTKFVTYAGSAPAANDCAKFDGNGNLTTNGTACGTGGGSGALTVQSNGTAVGTRGILNIVPGAGISTFISDTGSQINFQQTVDSAVVQTRANQQSGQTLLCSSASASPSSYTCSMSPVLTVYATGMTVNWLPDLNGAGAATTLNIDALGAKPIALNDGATNPGVSDIVAGRLYTLWFDGANFRMPAVGGGVSGGGGSPISVMFWPFGVGLDTAGSSETVGTANKVHYYEIYVPSPGIIVSKFASYTYNATADTGAIAWGIYDSNCSLVPNGNSSTATGTGTPSGERVVFNFSPAVALPGGKYFFAFASNNAVTQFYAAGGAAPNFAADMLSDSGANSHIFSGANLSATTGGVTTLPATCGARTAAGTWSNTAYPALAVN